MKTEIAYCKVCKFEEKFEPNEFGINYYEAIGTCPFCGEPTYYKGTDKFTKVVILIKAVDKEVE